MALSVSAALLLLLSGAIAADARSSSGEVMTAVFDLADGHDTRIATRFDAQTFGATERGLSVLGGSREWSALPYLVALVNLRPAWLKGTPQTQAPDSPSTVLVS